MSTQTKCARCGARYVKADTATTFCPQCAFAAAVTAPHEVEAEADSLLERLPGLHPVGKLGRGGMGVVYRARQTRLERDVAVKVISSEFASDPQFQRRFTQEAQILASLDHPNIVTIHDCGIQGDLEYFVMEYVDGESLRALLDRGAVKEPLRVALAVAEALAYAHDRGVIHRDIKPENVLIRRDGRVKVVDFGIARLGLGTSHLTRSDLVIGTPGYMAPEQRENPGAVDHRVDVYALGLLARELITGKGPQEGMPSVTGADDATAQVILRAMERDPSRRYQSMAEMASAIRSIVEPVQGHRPPRLPLRDRVARLRASRLFWVMMTGAAFLLVGLADRFNDSLPPDPKREFQRILTSKQARAQEEALRALKDPRIADRVDALLAFEAASPNEDRAAMAVRLSFLLEREARIPADVLARDLLLRVWKDQDVGFGNVVHGDKMAGHAVEAVKQAGPVMASEVYFDLVEGRIPEENQAAAVCAIAEVADATLVERMRDFLLARPNDPLASPVLIAFAGRADLPLPYDPVEVPFPPAVMGVYQKHLAGLLDESSKEVVWGKAVRLVKDLEALNIDNMGDALLTWKRELGADFAPAATPLETLARGLGLRWPVTPNDADALEQRIGQENNLPHPYTHALVVRWSRTGRFTLPFNRMAFLPWERPGPTEMNRYNEFPARTLLSLTSRAVRWEATTILFPSLAAAAEVAGVAGGASSLRASLTNDFPAGSAPPVVHVGVRPVRVGGAGWTAPSFTTAIDGCLNHVSGNEYNFVGDTKWSLSMGNGQGSSSFRGVFRCYANEANVLDLRLDLPSMDGWRYGYLTMVVAEPALPGEASQHWREAIAARLRGAIERKDVTGMTLDRLVSAAAWTPLPEATDPLKALWAMRADLLDHPSDECVPPDLRRGPQVQKSEYLKGAVISDLVGAALLLTGESSPLHEPGLLARLPKGVLLRIRLHSRSAEIRRAASGGELAIETPEDASAVERRLEELREEDTAIEDRARQVRQQAPSTAWKNDLTAWGVIVGLALLFGCLLPWRPMRPATLGHALEFAGLLLRFVTVEVGGRLWLPVLGDHLLLAAAFVYGGWGLRLLTLGLAVTGLLAFMQSSTPRIDEVSACLFCLYVAALAIDFLSRRLPGRIRPLEALALCATWWAMVVPIGFICVAMLVLGLTREEFSFTLFTVHGGWATLYFTAMVAGPLWLARANRLSR